MLSRAAARLALAGYFTFRTDTRALWETEAALRDAEQLRNGSRDRYVLIYSSTANAKRFNGEHVHITGNAKVIEQNEHSELLDVHSGCDWNRGLREASVCFWVESCRERHDSARPARRRFQR